MRDDEVDKTRIFKDMPHGEKENQSFKRDTVDSIISTVINVTFGIKIIILEKLEL